MGAFYALLLWIEPKQLRPEGIDMGLSSNFNGFPSGRAVIVAAQPALANVITDWDENAIAAVAQMASHRLIVRKNVVIEQGTLD